MHSCLYCQKIFTNGGGLATHQPYCKLNPNRIVRVIPANAHTKKGAIPWNKGLTKDDPRVARNAKNTSKALKGKPSKTIWTEEMRKAKSEWRKQLHIDHPEMHPNRKLAGNRNKMSYPEQVAFDFLTRSGVQFEHQKKVDKYFPDFIIGDIIIEIDGAQWHDAEKDMQRDAVLESHGYSVVRIKATDNIESRIKEVLGLG